MGELRRLWLATDFPFFGSMIHLQLIIIDSIISWSRYLWLVVTNGYYLFWLFIFGIVVLKLNLYFVQFVLFFWPLFVLANKFNFKLQYKEILRYQVEFTCFFTIWYNIALNWLKFCLDWYLNSILYATRKHWKFGIYLFVKCNVLWLLYVFLVYFVNIE